MFMPLLLCSRGSRVRLARWQDELLFCLAVRAVRGLFYRLNYASYYSISARAGRRDTCSSHRSVTELPKTTRLEGISHFAVKCCR